MSETTLAKGDVERMHGWRDVKEDNRTSVNPKRPITRTCTPNTLSSERAPQTPCQAKHPVRRTCTPNSQSSKHLVTRMCTQKPHHANVHLKCPVTRTCTPEYPVTRTCNHALPKCPVTRKCVHAKHPIARTFTPNTPSREHENRKGDSGSRQTARKNHISHKSCRRLAITKRTVLKG